MSDLVNIMQGTELMGATDDIRMYLQKANEVAERYDKNPTYNGSGHVFWIKDDDGGVIYDDIGVNASDAIEKMLVREQWNEGLKDIWENIRRGTNLNETME